jgi:hypothetical protein
VNKDTLKGYGLAKIIAKHGEEVVRRLDDIVMGGRVAEAKGNRIVLKNGNDTAVVILDWDNKGKQWVMTAYEKMPEGQTLADVPAKVGESDNLSPKAETSIAQKANDVKKDAK